MAETAYLTSRYVQSSDSGISDPYREAALAGRYVQCGDTGYSDFYGEAALAGRYVQSSDTAISSAPASYSLTGRYSLFGLVPADITQRSELVNYYTLLADDGYSGARAEGSLFAWYELDYTRFDVSHADIARVVYRCTLLVEGMDDLVVPIQSIQLRVSRLNDEQISQFCTVAIPAPNSVMGLSERVALGAGFRVEMIVYYRDGSSGVANLAEVDFEGTQYNTGSINSTLSLSGRRSFVPDDGALYTPYKIQTYSTDGVSSATLRCKPQFGLTVGMSMFYDGHYWNVKELVYNIGVSTSDQDVTLER